MTATRTNFEDEHAITDLRCSTLLLHVIFNVVNYEGGGPVSCPPNFHPGPCSLGSPHFLSSNAKGNRTLHRQRLAEAWWGLLKFVDEVKHLQMVAVC